MRVTGFDPSHCHFIFDIFSLFSRAIMGGPSWAASCAWRHLYDCTSRMANPICRPWVSNRRGPLKRIERPARYESAHFERATSFGNLLKGSLSFFSFFSSCFYFFVFLSAYFFLFFSFLFTLFYFYFCLP